MRARIPMIVLPTLVLLAGCSGTVQGTGSVGGKAARSSSRPDFPGSGAARAGARPVPHQVPSTPLLRKSVRAADGTVYPVQIWADVRSPTCADHAYGGPIVSFLKAHPCTGLRRYLGTTTVGGREVGFAMSSTGFHGPSSAPYKYADRFGALEEKDGTGSIDDLLRDGYRLPAGPAHIPASEAFKVVGQDEGVTVWDAWYLTGSTPQNDPALTKMAQDLFLQF